MRGARRILAFAALAIGLASTSIADDRPGFKLIINPENTVDSLDRDFVRDVYLKKATEWQDGETVHPLDLSASFAAREKFTSHIIRKTPAQLRAYWNQQIFSGKGVPPPEADSIRSVVSYVLSHRGAVGYIPGDADPGKAKVIKVH
jgi:ABC-type phosphate transport system substrate-binding protein